MQYLFIIFGSIFLIVIVFIIYTFKKSKEKKLNLSTTEKTCNLKEIKREVKTEVNNKNTRVFLSSSKYNNMDFNISLDSNIKKGVELKKEEKKVFFEIYENAFLNEIIYSNDINFLKNFNSNTKDEEIIFYIYTLNTEKSEKEYFNIERLIIKQNKILTTENRIYKINEKDISKLNKLILI